ncbi:4'-phosphopantetheinyl transferase family protein [Paenibacillus senegalimassiliensis]|uniref:4'-phosphopantetheinyl transferase family protein n=1 Tax=Paenibacillus senegalimassiliensis TaxID=1737426 RepID=UPI00073F7AD9|nr:4'-phosphopantetheinyl transferase family protein [Paenibacillus senegalimassiliensis]
MELTICSKPLFAKPTTDGLGKGSQKAIFRWMPVPQAISVPPERESLDYTLARQSLAPAQLRRYLALYRNPARQKELLHTRLLAKRLLYDYLHESAGMADIDEEEILLLQVEEGLRQGMPYLAPGPAWSHLNLSVSLAHGGGLLGAAVGENCLVGIDVEQARLRGKGFADLFLTTEEQQLMPLLFAGLAPDKCDSLMWSVKEAVGKALGTGFSRGFSSLRLQAATRTEEAGASCWLELDQELEIYAPGPYPRGMVYYDYDIEHSVCGVVCLLFS